MESTITQLQKGEMRCQGVITLVYFFLSIYLCIKTTRSGHKVSRKTSLGGAQPGVLDDFPQLQTNQLFLFVLTMFIFSCQLTNSGLTNSKKAREALFYHKLSAIIVIIVNQQTNMPSLSGESFQCLTVGYQLCLPIVTASRNVNKGPVV